MPDLHPEDLMIAILKRGDLKVNGLPADQIRTHHNQLQPATVEVAELLLLTEKGRVFVLHATKWPLKKSKSAAELYRYIAEHAMQSEKLSTSL